MELARRFKKHLEATEPLQASVCRFAAYDSGVLYSYRDYVLTLDNLALVSPSSTWQDSLQRLLSQTSATIFPPIAEDVEHAHGSPDHRTRRASFPLMSNNASARRVPPVSPMNSLPSSLSISSAPHADRALWEKIEGLEKIDSTLHYTPLELAKFSVLS